ncbi:MAG: DNA alkylation repair protein, partial [Proteobacteria bacterium]|nr:DNA alkylation repair protein [Pseudomonadota bacterium]
MKKSQVLNLVREQAASQKAIRTGPSSSRKSYGVGLTDLRKLAKKIGRDHVLALELWQSDIHELRILSLLIDDPKLITREQVEKQVGELDEPVLSHVFSSCDASLSRVPFVVELATDWIDSKDKARRKCGYGLLSEIAGSKKQNAPDDTFFLSYIDRIGRTYEDKGLV